ncbi:MAG: hypothetical protein ACOZNI_06920 [Myxococcota bacterium]
MVEYTGSYALISILDEIGRLRERHEREIEATLGEIGHEQLAARQALEEARRRVAALAAIRRQQERAKEKSEDALVRREREAVRDGLRADRGALEERAAEVRAAIEERESELAERLHADPEAEAALEAVQKYREVEHTLDRLPPSYRRALREKYDRARRRLDPFIAEVNNAPPPLPSHTIGIGVVLAMQPPDGRPEALVAVLPVPFAVHAEWATRPEDLCTTLSYRVVAAVFRLLREVGAPEAPVRFLEVHGSLAIQVWLGDSEVTGDFRERALDNVQRAWDEAVELGAASVEVYAAWLRPELLAEADGG